MRARLTSRLLASAALAVCACTPHEDAPELVPPQISPPIIQEAEPEIPLPAIVAPALPDLAPTRPLANLELRWHQDLDPVPLPHTRWPIGTSLVAMNNDDARALGLTGPPDELDMDAYRYGYSFRRAGPLTLVTSSAEFKAFEAGDGGLLWSNPPTTGAYSYLHFVSPRALVAGFYQSSGDALVGWALGDGRQLWTRQGGPGAAFSRILTLSSDGTRGYFTSDAGLEAFEPATGATLWTHGLSAPICGVAVAEGKVVLEDPRGHLILDAELGSELGRLARTSSACCWQEYDDLAVAAGVISGGRLYAFDSDPDAMDAATLRAFDLDTRRELWAASGFGDDTLVVDHDAVFVARSDQILVALDADTGAVAAEISLGEWFQLSVQPVGGAGGPLVVAEEGTGLAWVFGRGEQATPPEDWEIRGRLVSDGYLDKRRLAGVRVEVGGQTVKTDSRGRFVARGRLRGVVRVQTIEGDLQPDQWSTVAVDPQRIELDGSGSYDCGSIEAYEVSME